MRSILKLIDRGNLRKLEAVCEVAK